MNFFGHAAVAARRAESPGFVFGAMLPDLASMAGVRVRRRPPGSELQRGVDLHHECDAAFHRHPAFVRLCGSALEELTREGLSRGSARAVGHVGSELLLDGVLSADASALAAYHAALEDGERRLSGSASPEDCAVSHVLRRLADAPLPQGYADPGFVADRLATILSRRPRLALQADDLTAVVAWLEQAQPMVERQLGGVIELLR